MKKVMILLSALILIVLLGSCTINEEDKILNENIHSREIVSNEVQTDTSIKWPSDVKPVKVETFINPLTNETEIFLIGDKTEVGTIIMKYNNYGSLKDVWVILAEKPQTESNINYLLWPKDIKPTNFDLQLDNETGKPVFILTGDKDKVGTVIREYNSLGMLVNHYVISATGTFEEMIKSINKCTEEEIFNKVYPHIKNLDLNKDHIKYTEIINNTSKECGLTKEEVENKYYKYATSKNNSLNFILKDKY